MAFVGFRPAGGDFKVREAKAASAFSRGDLVQYDSNSSISRFDVLLAANDDIAGVALADSTDSINDLVPYMIPDSDTLFISRYTGGTRQDPGDELDIVENANGRSVVDTSTNSVRFVVEQGTLQARDQSVNSVLIGRLIRHAGNLEHS